MIGQFSMKGFLAQRMDCIIYVTYLDQILDRLLSLPKPMSGAKFDMNDLDT
jgi:hypothetical protein